MTPKHGNNQFQCPHCNTVASQRWFNSDNASSIVIAIIDKIYFDYRSHIDRYNDDAIKKFKQEIFNNYKRRFHNFVPNSFSIATCLSCNKFTLWVNYEIVYPKKTTLPPPNKDLDKDIKDLYLEASSIFIDSPRGSTAILRLALQKLLKQIGKSGDNINKDIQALVADGKIEPEIQQALDLIRVIGNNAVHPGTIDLKDNTETAQSLFSIFNLIAEELITRPKEIESMYKKIIPPETQNHIKQRDGK